MDKKQDAFSLFMHRGLTRLYDIPTDTPRELLTLVDKIVTRN